MLPSVHVQEQTHKPVAVYQNFECVYQAWADVRSARHNLDIPSQPLVHTSLPLELWGIIFLYCLPPSSSFQDLGDFKVNITDPRLVPLLLASVCRKWRHIACNLHQLWETCWVNFVHPALNTIWLARSDKRLLTLYGTCGRLPIGWGEPDAGLAARWDIFLLSIFPFQRRWESLELDVELSFLDKPWGATRSLFRFNTPHLKILRLRSLDRTPVWMTGLLSNVPQLHSLQTKSIWFGTKFGIALDQTHFPRLSSLNVRDIAVWEIIWILHQLPQLRHGNFYVYSEDDTEFTRSSPFVHHNLIDLSVQCAHEEPLSDLLENLTLPALQKFSSHYNIVIAVFLEFVERSQCRITEFRTKCADWEETDSEAIELLSHHSIGPWLENLELSPYHVTPLLLDFLRYRPEAKHLPHLEQLRFMDSLEASDLGIPEGLLADVIDSRCGSMVCECNSCKLLLQPREIRLQFVNNLCLPRGSVDVARIVPLDCSVDLEKSGPLIEIDVFHESIVGLWWPLKIWVGQSRVGASGGISAL